MKLTKLSATIAALAVAAMFDLLGVAKPAVAGTLTLFGLTDSNTLVSFDPNNATNTTSVGVSGVDGTLLGIDFRPANGLLYGVTDTNNIYTIDFISGAASLVSSLSPIPFGGGTESGVDFNPVPDRLRLVGSNDQNFRINVDTGAIADFDPTTPEFQPDGTLAYAATDANAGVDPNITAAAYANNIAGVTTTTLYGIDSALDILVQQAPPNNGTLNTIGSLGIDFGDLGGFDIFTDEVAGDLAFAASGSTLYTINLSDGTATTVGNVGSGDFNFRGLAATEVPEPGTIGALIGFGSLALMGRRRVKAHS